VLRYVVVDDVGTVINKLTLEGQIHGGVAQGIGQAFSEHLVYDKASGQLLTGSLMDYGLPRADEVCSFETDENPVPTKTNPLGVKGAGEAGNVGALAAIMNAVVDALSPLSITHMTCRPPPKRSSAPFARRKPATNPDPRVFLRAASIAPCRRRNRAPHDATNFRQIRWSAFDVERSMSRLRGPNFLGRTSVRSPRQQLFRHFITRPLLATGYMIAGGPPQAIS